MNTDPGGRRVDTEEESAAVAIARWCLLVILGIVSALLIMHGIAVLFSESEIP